MLRRYCESGSIIRNYAAGAGLMAAASCLHINGFGGRSWPSSAVMAAVAFDFERRRRELPTMSSLVQQCCPPTKSATVGAKAAREALQQALREGLRQAIGDPVARA